VSDATHCHNNTRRKAIALVIELIKEGNYDDELTFEQAISALNKCHEKLEKELP
jgi:hypothetical protein